MLKQHFALIGQMEEKEQKNLPKKLLNCVRKEKINLNFYMKIKLHCLKKLKLLLKKFIAQVKLWQIQKYENN